MASALKHTVDGLEQDSKAEWALVLGAVRGGSPLSQLAANCTLPVIGHIQSVPSLKHPETDP